MSANALTVRNLGDANEMCPTNELAQIQAPDEHNAKKAGCDCAKLEDEVKQLKMQLAPAKKDGKTQSMKAAQVDIEDAGSAFESNNDNVAFQGGMVNPDLIYPQ